MTPALRSVLAACLISAVGLAQGSGVLAQSAPSSDAEAAAAAADAEKPAATKPRARPAPQPPAAFLLRDIAFTDSDYLSKAELQAVESRLIGRRYPASQLQNIANEINALYAAKGIVTAQAILRQINPRSGLAMVELLEARVGRVRASEGPVSDAYFAYRLRMPNGALADNRVIESRVNSIRRIEGLPVQLTYAAGAEYGQTDIILAQPNLPRHVTTLTVDNYGSPGQGELQLTFSHTIRSLTGWNDPLSLSVTGREGARGISLSYARTVTPGGGSLSLSVSGTNTKTINAPQIKGRERSIALTYTQPVITEEDMRVSLSFGIAGYMETADLLGVRTLDQRGGELVFGASVFRRGAGWSITSTPRLMIGRYDDRVTNSSHDYALFQGNVYLSLALGEALVGTVTIATQKSLMGVMPSQRKFTITAPGAVRGYPTSLSSGDSGYYARVQLEKARAFTNGSLAARPFVFFDAGQAFDSTGTGLGLAASVGLGLSFSIGERGYGDIYVAKPLTTNITGWTNPSRDPTLGVSFSLTF